MKKRLYSVLLILLLFLGLSTSVFAASPAPMLLVTDAAGVLTEEEAASLNALADTYSARYECEIIVVTVSALDGWNVEEFAEAVYEQYDFGYGDGKDGIMLLLSMEGRDFDLDAYGYGNVAFTDYGKEQLMDSVLPYLRDNNWAVAFEAFIELSGSYLDAARAGNPIDIGSTPRQMITPGKAIVALIIGLLAAVIVRSKQRSEMRSAVLQSRADQYRDELQLDGSEDRFLRSDIRRIRRESNSGSRSGHGGTSVNSHGHSHHSGKF